MVRERRLRIEDQRDEGCSEDSAVLVDLFDGQQLGRQGLLLAPLGERARQSVQQGDLDRV
jgi:hypothetical protein